MSCGSTTVTNKTQPPQAFTDAYKQVLGLAKNQAAQPLQQYQGNIVAGFNPSQESAFNTVDRTQGAYKPYLNQAGDLLNQATGPLWSNVQQYSPQAMSQYMNPYTQQVVNATQSQFQNQNAQQQQELAGNAISKGAWGGDRAGVAQGILAGQQQLSQAPVIAGLYNQGFQQQQQEFNQQQQQELSAKEAEKWLASQGSFAAGNLANQAQSLPFAGASAQLQTGALRQQLEQEKLNVPYYQFLQQQAYPFQTTGWLANIAEGLGGSSGGLSSTSSPPPNALSQVTGLGTLGLGLYNAGAFGTAAGTGATAAAGAGALDAAAGASGAASGGEGIASLASMFAFAKDGGGIIPRRADGGNVIRFPIERRDLGGMIPALNGPFAADMGDLAAQYSGGIGSGPAHTLPFGPSRAVLGASPLVPGSRIGPTLSDLSGIFGGGGKGEDKAGDSSSVDISPRSMSPLMRMTLAPSVTLSTGSGGGKKGGDFLDGVLNGFANMIPGVSTGSTQGDTMRTLNVAAHLKRGGMIPGFDDGGATTDDPRFEFGDPNQGEEFKATGTTGMAPVNSPYGPNFGLTRPKPVSITPERPDPSMALIAAGLGMMSGTSPYFGANVGRGGLMGLQEYIGEKERNRSAAKDQADLDVKNNQQQFEYEKEVPELGLSQEDKRLRAQQLADDLAYRRDDMAMRAKENASQEKYRNFEMSKDNRSEFEQKRAALTQGFISQGDDPVTADRKATIIATSPYSGVNLGVAGNQLQAPAKERVPVRPVGMNKPEDEVAYNPMVVDPLSDSAHRELMKKAGDNAEKRYDADQVNADNAQTNSGDFNALESALSDPHMSTGKLANAQYQTSAWLYAVDKATGASDADALKFATSATGMDPSKSEIFGKASTRMGLTFARQTEGAREAVQAIQIALGANPQLGTTAEGNKKIIALLKASNQRVIDKQQYGKAWFEANKDRVNFDAWFNSAHPMLEYTSKVLPLPVPVDANGNPDTARMIPNVTYQVKGGRKAYWDGEKPVEVP